MQLIKNTLHLLFLGFLILLCKPAYTQKTRLEWIEHRRAIWENSTNSDSVRFQAIDRLIMRNMRKIDADSALIYAEKQLAFAKARKNKEWIGTSLTNKGRMLLATSSFTEARTAYMEALEIYESLAWVEKMAFIYTWIAYTLRKEGRLTEALEYYQKSLDISMQRGDAGRITTAATLNSMGSLFLDQNNYEKALEYYQKSLELHRAIDRELGIAANYNNISQVYYFMGDYDQAKIYLEKSRPIKEKAGDVLGLGNIYHNLGDLAVKVEDFDEADKNYLKALELRDSVNNKADLASSYNALGHNALRREQAGQAINWCRQGSALSELVGDIEETAASADCLFQAFQRQNQADSALAYHVLMTTLKDSLFNQEKTRKLAQMEAQYHYERERSQLQADLRRQHLFRNAAIIIIAFFIILTFLAFRLITSSRSKNRILHAKNQQIEQDRALIRQQAEELKVLDQMKSRFFTNISHELRTPITLITAPVERLIQRYADQLEPAINRTHQLIYRNAKKMSILVEELLELSRLEAGQQQLSNTPTQLNTFCRQLFSAYTSAANDKGVQYEYNSKLPENATVLIDKKRLSKIINNLISNALKFTARGDTVLLEIASHEYPSQSTQPSPVSARQSFSQVGNSPHHLPSDEADRRSRNITTSSYIYISVSDTGRGISPEDLPHVFDRYFQTKRKDIPTEGGTGIGLALSKELAILMGGSLNVESKWGEGSTFTLHLPVQEAPPPHHEVLRDAAPPQQAISPHQPPSEGAEKRSQNITTSPPARHEHVYRLQPVSDGPHSSPLTPSSKILIVEDNTDMQALLIELLADDFELRVVNNGQEAWELLQTDKEYADSLSLILSDIMMPKMNGYELLEKIKESSQLSLIPALMITARADEKDKLKALRMGIDDYLTKPFSASELVARAINLVQHHKQRKEHLSEVESKLPDALSKCLEPAEQLWLQKLETITLEAINQKVALKASSLAAKMSISERQLRRKIKATTGLAINAYINEVKLQKARQLLENQSYATIAEVAYASGFNTPGYFTQVYEKRFGKRPGDYMD